MARILDIAYLIERCAVEVDDVFLAPVSSVASLHL
jgi:hypothetical protein